MKPLKFVWCLLAILLNTYGASGAVLPDDHREMTTPVSYAGMQEVVAEAVAAQTWITSSVAGQSVEGRDLVLVNLNRGGDKADWKVFFYGVQHGDEHAGKDALVTMIRDIARNPEMLPERVDLWIMPMVNPDGVEADRRRNSNDADLNRDHVILMQPETRILHRVARELHPHIAVDCHEFRRDTGDYTSQGWTEWPQIMMDAVSNPFLDDALHESAMEWVDGAALDMSAAGHNYCRYIVGSAPPAGELRFSTLDVDDGRNGLGTYGILSFIIESGIYRGADDPQADLGTRVDAYRVLLGRFLTDDALIDRHLQVLAAMENRSVPAFLPINYFWGSEGLTITEVPVVDAKTGTVKMIPMANFMDTRVVKKSVPTPSGYLVRANAAGVIAPMLSAGGITFKTVEAETSLVGETCKLLAVDEDYDEVYERYDGRQRVERGDAAVVTARAGDLIVRLDAQEWPRRAALVLDPTQMYGLYQYPEFRTFVTEDGTMPVVRLTD